MPNGKSKSNAALYQESVPEMCNNIPKAIKLDTGGSKGIIPKSIMDAVAEIQSLSTVEAAKFLMRRDNARMTAVRKDVMRRTVAIQAKLAGRTYQEYEEILKKKLEATASNKRKKVTRQVVLQ